MGSKDLYISVCSVGTKTGQEVGGPSLFDVCAIPFLLLFFFRRIELAREPSQALPVAMGKSATSETCSVCRKCTQNLPMHPGGLRSQTLSVYIFETLFICHSSTRNRQHLSSFNRLSNTTLVRVDSTNNNCTPKTLSI